MATPTSAISQAVKAEANRRYNEGHGWQVFVECYTDEELTEEFGRCRTVAGALKKAVRLARLRTEHHDEIAATAF